MAKNIRPSTRGGTCLCKAPPASKYKLFAVLVKDQNQAVEVCKKLVPEEGIHSILLCPGFAHGDVAEIAGAVGENVAVAVARGDGPSSRVSMGVMKRECWF